MSRIKNIFINEKGSVVIIVALSMVVLIGFAALAVDGGYLYFRHTRFQDAADAIALAAAIELGGPGNNVNNKQKQAYKTAEQYAKRNGFTFGTNYTDQTTAGIRCFQIPVTYIKSGESGTMKVIFPSGVTKVQVDIEVKAKLYMARVMGINSSQVPVSATAQVGQAASQSGGIIPVSIVDDPANPNDGNFVQWRQYDMTLGPGGGSNGNYGWLNFDGTNNTFEYLQNGYPGTLTVNQTVYTQTGVAVGQAASAIAARLAPCTTVFSTYTENTFTYYYKDPITNHLAADPNCPRLVYTPIVDSYGSSGTSPVTILGFAAFFLDTYIHNGSTITLRGAFINKVNPADIIPSNLSYTTQSVRLIK